MAKKTNTGPGEVFDFGTTAYLAGGSALVVLSDSREMVGDSRTPVEDVTPVNQKKKTLSFVRRGQSNKQPVEVMEKIYANSTLGANVAFNAKMAYGDGVMVMRKRKDAATGKVTIEECLESEYPDVFSFIRDNNYVNCVQEWANDIVALFEGYVEFIFARDKSNRIVRINPIESVNSRLSVADEKTHKVEWHGYSMKWHEGMADDVKVTPLLDRRTPLLDLKTRRGMIMNTDGKTAQDGNFSYILQLMMPTPGRYYHGKPYWWAIFEAGWYDFACAIPQFKKALLKNQMTIKYHVKISNDFWSKLFKSEAIPDTDVKARISRKRKFLNDLNEFLSGEENAGKSFVSHFEYDRVKGFEMNDILITPVESFFKGGEYLDDSEEVTNIICYAMEIHPSLIGATGKSKSISGTETRELFIIKQAMMKPIRDLLTLPLYIVKEMNGWDRDLHFVIPNIMLTTLDKNTGAEKSIGNQKV